MKAISKCLKLKSLEFIGEGEEMIIEQKNPSLQELFEKSLNVKEKKEPRPSNYFGYIETFCCRIILGNCSKAKYISKVL